eukprot:138014-Chlamydomonas_euryale.AAC.1
MSMFNPEIEHVQPVTQIGVCWIVRLRHPTQSSQRALAMLQAAHVARSAAVAKAHQQQQQQQQAAPPPTTLGSAGSSDGVGGVGGTAAAAAPPLLRRLPEPLPAQDEDRVAWLHELSVSGHSLSRLAASLPGFSSHHALLQALWHCQVPPMRAAWLLR